jgi:aminoglycoside 3-N-acetyltransferase I
MMQAEPSVMRQSFNLSQRPTMGYTFEQLATSDIHLLKDLLQVFGEAFEDIETYQGAVPKDDYLRSLLAMRHFIVVVARRDGEVVGGLAAYELQKF